MTGSPNWRRHEACSAMAILSTTKRARGSSAARSSAPTVSSERTSSSSPSYRECAPRAPSSSSTNACTACGSTRRLRITSRQITFPLPSQMPLSGACRYIRAIGPSSTYPLPPRHSIASCATPGARLHTQYLATAVPTRRSSPPLPSAGESKEDARRSHVAFAASDSRARSASTARISGACAKFEPNADRCAAWCAACCVQWRIRAEEPMMQSSRVCTTISTMVFTPRPAGPTRTPHALLYSTSLDALEWSPSLAFSRCTVNPELRLPSGSHLGTRKHESPSSVCASVRKPSDIGADVNHLWPRSVYSPPPTPPPGAHTAVATLVFARTSEPPCFSVIDMPSVAAAFSPSGTSRGSYARAHSRGSQPAATPPARTSAGTAAKVIVSGQQTPGSSWYMR
mmetsp:Transcript_22629/g.56197  ORF Transcript_22629/g.56197 Transcript_22629/m.56197 type:complete len:398 (+) Transcript_22629:572-1765(+)